MPLLSYEGVEVDIPTSLTGIQFVFRNGALAIQCTNFTGEVVLSKPPVAAAPPVALAKKRSLDPSSFVGDDDDDDSNSDSNSNNSASELLVKRPRPNGLDVSTPVVAAKAERKKPNSSTKAKAVGKKEKEPPVKKEKEPLVKKDGKSSKAVVTPKLSTVAKASVAASATTIKKTTMTTVQTTLFSPDATAAKLKQLTQRKATPESHKKRSRLAGGGAATTTSDSAGVATGAWRIVPAAGTAPIERWGATVTMISHNRVVVYGGADDDELTLGSVHVFDVATNSWSTPLNCTSTPRVWHDASFLARKHLLLVFGGERYMGNDQVDVLADLMVLDTECFLWYPPAVSGVAPPARSGHSCTVVGDDVVVLGGSKGRSRQHTVHVLDSNTWHWKAVAVSGKPPPVTAYHTATALSNSTVVVFGGNDAKKCFNVVHVLQTHSTWTWHQPLVHGTPPCPRTGHSATLLDATKLLIYGGWDPQIERNGPAVAVPVFTDAFVLDTATWTWSPVALTTTTTLMQQQQGENGELSEWDALPSRVGHRAVLDSRTNNVLVFHGQNNRDKRLSVVQSLALTFPESTLRNQSSKSVLDDNDAQQPEPEAAAVGL